MADAGMQVSALALRRPTLEETFLALTGQPTGNPQADGSGGGDVADAGPPQPAGKQRSTP